MKIFISYARVDKHYCARIAEILDIHDCWYDQRLYAGQDWWREILNRLDWCEGFVYLLSPDSVRSKYCRKEFEIARRLNKKILPVLIDADTRIPKILEDIHYLDMTSGPNNTEAVQALFKSVYIAEQVNGHHSEQVSVAVIPVEETELDVVDEMSSVKMIGQAAEAMEMGDFDDAVRLLKQAKERGYTSSYFGIDTLIREAEIALLQKETKRKTEIEYKAIAELVKRGTTRKLGCQAFTEFHKEHPSVDPDNLMGLCSRKLDPIIVQPLDNKDEVDDKQASDLPLLEWCFVPDGMMINDSDSARVPEFYIAKYPVTNAQYQFFLDDPDGYTNQEWWRFSNYALNWIRRNPKGRLPRYAGDERPRESVTWYEAMAFCRWLSARIGKTVTLPTRNQWRRASQGEDSRIYPWGDEFNKDNCNTRESRIRMTTVVMRYLNGVSPFGVMDMSGNVWEWCLDPTRGATTDISTNDQRAVLGGSFMTSYDRAQIDFHFHLAQEYYYGTIGFRVVRLD